MFIEQLNKKMEENMIYICALFAAGQNFLAPLFLYICFETLVSILQNSPSLSWQNFVIPCKIHISFIWHRFELIFGAFIVLWVLNPPKFSLHQSDFCSSRYEGLNEQRSTSADCKIWLWRMRFLWYSLFYFFFLIIPERYGC